MLPGSSVTFQWTTGSGVSQYWLSIGKVGVGASEIYNADPGPGLVTSKTITGLPTDGSTIYVRLYSYTGNWASLDYTYTAAGPATITSPANGSTFTSSSVTFQWTTGIAVTQYWLSIGKTGVGGGDLFNADPGPGLVTSKTITGLPADGSTIYVRLYSHIGGNWPWLDYTYTAAGSASITSPANGTTLPGSSITFQWTAGTGVTQYWLSIGKVGVGGGDLYNSDPGPGLVTSKAISGLPTDGSTIYVRLYSHIGGNWPSHDYTYSAASPDFSLGVSPASATVTAGNSVSYTVTASATHGFNGTVNLTLVALPSGITGTFSPSSITGSGTSTLTINVPSASTAATYTVSVNGSSGSRSHSATASLSVQPSSTTASDCSTPFWGDSRVVMVTPNDAYAYAETWSIDPGASYWTNYVTGTLKRDTTTINGPLDATPTTGTTHARVQFPNFDPTLPSGTYVMTGEHWKLNPGCQTVPNYGRHFFDSFKLSVPEVRSVSPSPSYGVTGGFTRIDVYGVGLSGITSAQMSGSYVPVNTNVVNDTHIQVGFDISSYSQASTTPRSVTLKALNPNIVTDNSDPNNPRNTTINTPVNANPFNFYVSDPSPVIVGVQQVDPLYPDDPAGAYIVIYGSNFGSGQGTLGFCLQGSPDPCASGDISSSILFWGTNSQGYSQVNAFLTATSTAAFGDYDVQLTAATGAIGMSFQPAPGGQTKPTTRGRPVRVTPKASTVKLIQFGWGNNQELWKATTFGSNGDSQIGPVVWSDPNGDGNVTINEPAALQAGSDVPYLSNIVLRTNPPVTAMAELQVVVVQTGFVFRSLSFQFVNGQATIANMNLGGPIPRQISNATYDFQWNIRFSPTSTFQTFKTTSHRLYLMHGLFNAGSTGYRATTKRLDYVTGLAQGLSDVTAIVSGLQTGLEANPKFDARSPLRIEDQNNVWAALDSPPPPEFMGYDCESVSGIAIAQLQQLGYSTPQLGLAYPTGALPPGDTDATTPERQFVVADLYSLAFAGAGVDPGLNGNFFQGFLYLSPPDTPSLTAYTVFPWSMGALNFTACDVLPSSASNLIAFRVLTNTYHMEGVPYQYWLWDPRVNHGPQPPNPKFGQIPLPATCPATEYP